MKNKISYTTLDGFILEQTEGTKALCALFEKISKITEKPDVKAFSRLGIKFCNELHTDCKTFAKVLSEIKKILGQFFQNPDEG